MRKEIRISGFGGQGVVLAGTILGKALSLHAGLEAVMTQAYGPEARGGASSADIVVSDEAVDYPFVEHPDILVALSQEAYTRFRPAAPFDALVLIDEDLVIPLPDDHPHRIPATGMAETLGGRIMANMVMLGFFTGVTGLVDREAMREAIESSVKAQTAPLNLQAFEVGFEHARPALSEVEGNKCHG
ncbi:MAG TPA: 2-oxoacid:acceptor oxidoreductase family protein [Anaerolineae bacterium]|nr:2-oxoacid:acceptor oxidoreductase family protein [Anaerolineae bacterium]